MDGKYIKRKLLEIARAVLILSVVLALVFYSLQPIKEAKGATFNFTQTSWSSKTSTLAEHNGITGPPTDWNQYSDNDSTVNTSAGTKLELNTAAFTKTLTTDADFSGGTPYQTQVVGQGESSTVQLTSSGSTNYLFPSYTSVWPNGVQIGTDGNSRILFRSDPNGTGTFIQCLTGDCSQKTTSAVFIAFNDTFALNDNDLAQLFLSYGSLVFKRCLDKSCGNVTTGTTIANSGAVFGLALGKDSNDKYPRLLYKGSSGQTILTKCNDIDCVSKTTNSIINSDASNPILAAVLDIGQDNNPRIAYITGTTAPFSLNFIRCTDPACSPENMIISPLGLLTSFNTNASSIPLAMRIGTDDRANMVFRGINSKTTFFKCVDRDCSSGNPVSFETSYEYPFVSIDLGPGPNNLPSFTYDFYTCSTPGRGGCEPDPILVRCNNASCLSYIGPTVVKVDTPWTGSYSNVKVGQDGYARIIHRSQESSYVGLRLYYPVFYPSGTFTSGAVDLGVKALTWGNFSWANSGNQSLTNITMEVRSGSDTSFSNHPSFCPTTLESSLLTNNCVSSGDQYFQYRATLTNPGNSSETPKLDDITIGYTSYPASATLTSSVYNTNEAKNIISKISWNGSYETVKFQMRSSSDGVIWTNWCGYTVCDNFDVFDASNNGQTISPTHEIGNGEFDQFFQYKAILYSGGIYTPTLNDVTITYVVNAPPEIKDNTITASQIIDQADANWGKFQINYSVKDVDTNEGSPENQGKISPSFFYDLTGNCALTDNNCWQAITNSTLTISPTCDITANKIDCLVAATTYTDYTVLWNVASQLSDDLKAFSTNARIRVVLNDNEAANNIARLASSPTTLDTKPPVASVFKIDSTLKQINLTATDDSILEYRISNKSDLTTDGSNTLSNDWQKPNTNSITVLPTAWTLTGSTDYESVYVGVRDKYNNLLKTTYTAPYAPRNIDIKDVSNVEANNYRLFIIWDKYDATSTAPFAKYEVYRSLDGITFSLFTTITNVDLNYYPDTSVIASTRYYYKVRMIDAEGDVSDYSETLNDLPDGVSEGEGGGAGEPLSIVIAPYAKEIKAFSAKIAWSTSNRSNSVVYYSTDKSFSKSTNNTALVADHEVLLTGLSSNTTYYFKVESADVDGKKVSADNDGAGYAFTTVSGPTISGTAVESVTNKTATITWNTNMDTNSYVVYSRSTGNLQGNSSVSEVGDANMVGGPPYQHRIKITGLDEETTYYFYVKSTDSESNIVVDNNKGAFYSLKTTNDTKAPVISEITPITVLSKAAVISWTTDEPSDGQIEFGSTSGHYPKTTPINTNMNIDHVGVLSELSPKATYFYRVKSADSAGNATSSNEQKLETSAAGEALVVVTKEISKTIHETTPPIISNIRVISADAFKTTIAFDTDEASIGFVLYGKTIGYKNAEASTGFATKHEITLPGLIPGAIYHFQVKAQDQYGNVSRAEDKTFTTKFISEALQEQKIQLENISQLQDYFDTLIESITPSLATPIISDIKITNTAETSAKITWKTNVRTSSMVALSESKDYKKGSYSTEIGNSQDQVTQHSIDLLNLRPGTSYHFMVKSFRIPQLVGTGPDMTFTTKASRIQAGVYDITNNSFRAIWTTSEPTTSIVEYQNLTTKETFRKAEDAKIINHAMKIENLSPAMTYKVRIFGYNQDNDIIDTKDSILVATSRDTVPPQITGLKIDSALIPGRTDRTQTVVAWRTDEPATTLVYYQEGSGTFKKDTASKVEITDGLTQNHIISITSLKVGTIYQIQVASTDQAGNYASIDPRTVVAPQQPESIMDIIFKNFSDTFQFVNKLR